jgi:hypothetical protein
VARFPHRLFGDSEQGKNGIYIYQRYITHTLTLTQDCVAPDPDVSTLWPFLGEACGFMVTPVMSPPNAGCTHLWASLAGQSGRGLSGHSEAPGFPELEVGHSSETFLTLFFPLGWKCLCPQKSLI